MLKINDIKPIVEIPDYTIYLYYGLIILGIIFGIFLIYLLYLKFRSKHNLEEKQYFQYLKDIEFSNQKEAAYTITKYGRLLAKDDRQIQLLNELIYYLEEFKYKKQIDKQIPQNIKVQYETFMESLDV